MSIPPRILVVSFPCCSASTYKVLIVGCDPASTATMFLDENGWQGPVFPCPFTLAWQREPRLHSSPACESDGENGTPPDCSAL